MRHYKLYGFLFLTPVVIGVGILYLMIIWNIGAAFTEWQGLKHTWQFAGFKHFMNLFSLRRFWVNVGNNFLWLLLFIGPTTLVGFVLAYLFSNIGRAENVFRQVFLFPMALSFIITGVLWSWMYDPGSGLINTILRGFGVNTLRLGWLADPKIAIYCMIFTGFWQYVGFAMVIYLGAIRGLSDAMIEAARIDGAGRLRILFQIIFPNVGHGTLICTTMLGITTVKVFDLVWLMTGGGPGIKTEVLPYLMYRLSFSQRNLGMGAATSIVILLLAALLVIPYSLWALKKWVKT
jgi:glucose/mannose transport system permease protein